MNNMIMSHLCLTIEDAFTIFETLNVCLFISFYWSILSQIWNFQEKKNSVIFTTRSKHVTVIYRPCLLQIDFPFNLCFLSVSRQNIPRALFILIGYSYALKSLSFWVIVCFFLIRNIKKDFLELFFFFFLVLKSDVQVLFIFPPFGISLDMIFQVTLSD